MVEEQIKKEYMCEVCFHHYPTKAKAKECENKDPEKQQIRASKSAREEIETSGIKGVKTDSSRTNQWEVGDLVFAFHHEMTAWLARIIGIEERQHVLYPETEPVLGKRYGFGDPEAIVLLSDEEVENFLMTAEVLLRDDEDSPDS